MSFDIKVYRTDHDGKEELLDTHHFPDDEDATMTMGNLKLEIIPGEPTVAQAPWDPGNHEHIEGFHEHEHPHGLTVHSNMDGLVGKGENTGNTFVHVQGAEPAIVGEPPEDS